MRVAYQNDQGGSFLYKKYPVNSVLESKKTVAEGLWKKNSPEKILPMLIQDYLDICDPVLTFDRFMGEIELEKYLDNKSKMTQISQYELQKGNWKEEID